MPSARLINEGRSTHPPTLLIHEATLSGDMVLDACKKRHSTTPQAIDVAKRMGAYSLILTHLSQRFPKLPLPSDIFTNNNNPNNPSVEGDLTMEGMEIEREGEQDQEGDGEGQLLKEVPTHESPCVAFDLMTVSLSSPPLSCHYLLSLLCYIILYINSPENI